jgi:hypothetical protein
MLEEIIKSLNLPAWLYLPAAIIATVGTIVIKNIKTATPQVKAVAKSIQAGLITADKIDTSVTWFLTKFGVPQKFADYVGDIVSSVMARSPQFLDLPPREAISTVAGLITATGAANVKKLLPTIPADVNSKEFARRRFIYGLIAALKPGVDEIAALANGTES